MFLAVLVKFASTVETVTIMPFNNRKLNPVRLYGKEVGLSEIGAAYVAKFISLCGACNA